MATTIEGPGCFCVESKISQPDILDEETFLKWYDGEHIPEMLQTSAIKSAHRFKDINPDADKPYLVTYPLENIGFLLSDDFRSIKLKSNLLPETGEVYVQAHFDFRCDTLIQVYDPTAKGKGHVKSIISVQIELKEGADAADFDKWYREEHLGLLSKATGYLRTTRFKLAQATSNAQARASQGLTTTDEPASESPVWLSIHEFEVDNPDLLAIRKLTASPWTEKIYEGRKLGIFKVYKIQAEFGEKDWFHGVQV